MIDTRDGAGKAEKKPWAPARCELKEKKKERKKERKNDTMPFDWVSSGWKKKYFAAISPHIMTSNQLFSPSTGQSFHSVKWYTFRGNWLRVNNPKIT